SSAETAADPGSTKAAADGPATKTSAEAATVKASADAAAVKAAALGERVIRQAGQEQQPCNSSEPNPFHALPPCPRRLHASPLAARQACASVREGRWRNRHLKRERFMLHAEPRLRVAPPCKVLVSQHVRPWAPRSKQPSIT